VVVARGEEGVSQVALRSRVLKLDPVQAKPV
jgi:hypothetical protein